MSGVSRQEFRDDIRGVHQRLDHMNELRESQFKLLTDKLGPVLLLTDAFLELKKNNLKTRKITKKGYGFWNHGGGELSERPASSQQD